MGAEGKNRRVKENNYIKKGENLKLLTPGKK